MNIIHNQQLKPNVWLHLDDETDSTHPAVSVSLSRWSRQRMALIQHPHRLAVRLEPEDDPANIVDDLNFLSMVAICFPTFAEGRGYTQARRLRQNYGYRGEIRSINAHRDHLQFMSQVGINAFELAAGEDPEAALAVLQQQRTCYQNVIHSAIPVSNRIHPPQVVFTRGIQS